uniref:NBCH_WD40 domain-containing protein n=1 Tax=Macrostomum lignano TaxID=282301 RepID=A0A1I8IRA4_9PLAT
MKKREQALAASTAAAAACAASSAKAASAAASASTSAAAAAAAAATPGAVNQTQVSPAPTYVSQQSGSGGATEVPVLPLSLDPLVTSLNSAKRHLGDNFDQRIKVRACQFAMTPDNKILFACGYWDKSFRVYSTDTGKIIQCNFSQDCYVVTGSSDCTLLLWLWSSKSSAIVGDSPDAPAPKATLTGHHEEITVVAISAELGIIVSGSKDGLLLMHTTHGELIRSLDLPPGTSVPDLVSINREGVICVKLDDDVCASYTLNGKLMRHVNAHDRLEAMILSRCGQYVITAGDSGTAEVRRTHDLAAIYAFPVCDSPIRSLALTHDQKFLLAGMSTGCLIVFNIDFNRWHHEFQERYA